MVGRQEPGDTKCERSTRRKGGPVQALDGVPRRLLYSRPTDQAARLFRSCSVDDVAERADLPGDPTGAATIRRRRATGLARPGSDGS